MSAFCIAAPHSGSGKTTVTLGLLAALRSRGFAVQPFKCGPDYIDAGHHRRACGVASRNLDTWMMGEDAVRASFAKASQKADVAVIEGVMGLFDGASASGLEGSTAHVARLLGVPVVLVVDARAMARSLAALVKGFVDFETGVRIVGVIANNVSTESHASILKEALASSGMPPLLGCLPRRDEWRLPERHLGLIADTEAGIDEKWFDSLAGAIERHVDITQLLRLSETARPSPSTISHQPLTINHSSPPSRLPPCRVRLGIARDAAFHFYYEDNLDLLRESGVEWVPFSPLTDAALPQNLDALYIGGGFPEMFAKRLSGNKSMCEAIRAFSAAGAVYAECGGLMYLGRTLTDGGGREWGMCGVLPVHTAMGERLSRLGYVEVTTLAEGPLGQAGAVLRGHEFHWSAISRQDDSTDAAYSVRYARSGERQEAGLRVGRVWASYLHLHFASCPAAARNWVQYIRRGRGDVASGEGGG